MKVKFLILATAISLGFLMPSCNKTTTADDNVTKETIALVDTIAATDTFTYTLPDNLSDDPYQITTQASHFLKSELSTDSNGKTIYTYIYSGSGETYLTDDVVIANVEEVHKDGHKDDHKHGKHFELFDLGGKKHHDHPCDSAHTEVERTITIHFVVK